MRTATGIDHLLECLLVLSSFHGSSLNRESLVAGLPLEKQHLTPSLFARAAARAGFVSKILKKPLEALKSRALPAVLLLEGDEACVLMSWSRNKQSAQVIYPEFPESVMEVPAEKLDQRYSGAVIYARPKLAFDARTPEVTNHKPSHWFWGAMRENLALYRDVLLAALFINVFALALPLFTMNVYDRVVPNHAFETLWVLAFGIGIVLIADLLLRTMRGYFLDLAGKRVDILLSVRIMQQVLGLKMEYRPLSVGAFAANLRSFETVRDFITSASLTALIDLPFTLIFILVLGWISPLMMVPSLIGVFLILCYAMTTKGKMKHLTESMYQASSMRNSVLIESLIGLDTLKILTAEGVMQRRWEKAAAYLDRVGVQLRLLATSNLNFAMWIQQLVSVSVIVIGVYLISEGELSLGGLIATMMLANRAMAPLGQAAALLTQYHNARASLTTLNAIMEQPVERPADQNFFSRGHLRGEIEFRKVGFTYPGAEVQALRGISFHINAGEHVAILGRVGSGKTTLQRLTVGLYQASEGAILVDGIDVRQLDPAELRHQVGFVPQEATLFYGTLRENLTFADPMASDEAVERAVRVAELYDFVNAHPQGYDMNVGERGEFLSGGQRKAVALARSIIHEPPLLLLDEVTGSMDHASEAAILKNLRRYAVGKTMLVITHHTALLELVDRIIVLDSGKIVADGPRDQVVEALRKGRIGRAV
ncbi:type I secretion system permease/ATPase [Aliamphritea spongicola]|uniref:type I secretion system permease/ATPase n=1 Tax=Aliamphritea spongicola TaxID=707589 RepID=UPI00196B8BCA|nr:type I secretion system permease/ATPase [Aliamphritea spongicola]MBN3562660.1 type I secretion system permease/ATPase [Aliamphritea spongicola]